MVSKTSKVISIFGIHAVDALIRHSPWRALKCFIQNSQQNEQLESIIGKCQSQEIPLEYVDNTSLDKMTHNATHQGVVVNCQRQELLTQEDINTVLEKSSKRPLILILDGIQDPHNLGACLRTAEAQGVTMVITPKHHAVALTPIVYKVACGALETIPFVQVTNLVRAIKTLQELGIWVYGLSANAKKSLQACDFNHPSAIILGSEGTGLRRLTEENCDELLSIPMYGDVPSLNVSVSTGIALFEVNRQRMRNSTQSEASS